MDISDVKNIVDKIIVLDNGSSDDMTRLPKTLKPKWIFNT